MPTYPSPAPNTTFILAKLFTEAHSARDNAETAMTYPGPDYVPQVLLSRARQPNVPKPTVMIGQVKH